MKEAARERATTSGTGSDIGGNHRRIAANGFGYPVGDDPAGIKNRDPFRQCHHKSHVMFDEQNRYAGALNPAHNGGQFLDFGGVHPARRLVEQKKPWPAHQRAGNFHTALVNKG